MPTPVDSSFGRYCAKLEKSTAPIRFDAKNTSSTSLASTSPNSDTVCASAEATVFTSAKPALLPLILAASTFMDLSASLICELIRSKAKGTVAASAPNSSATPLMPFFRFSRSSPSSSVVIFTCAMFWSKVMADLAVPIIAAPA